MAVLQAKNLTKQFGDFVAANNISLELKEGEILGLLGPNGAGKTTTIQMLLGVLTPTSGRVFYFGKNFYANRTEILERVNFSSTYTNLPWDLSVSDNLSYLSYLYKIENRKQRISELVKNFQLEELMDQRISELSAGQITRVNLTKAFINSPKVLLLDEPTASLDPDVANYIREFLLERREKEKLSMIFTSHNMSEVEEICDRVVFINHGKIVADDTPEKLARTIEICHVDLLTENPQILMDFCRGKNLNCKKEGKHVVVDVKEKQLPEFLNQLAMSKISYREISIDKPTLEDYFLENARKKL